LESLAKKILDLKKKLNAVILAHYYQEDDVQDIADFIGDSLELAKKAKTTDADVIVFCGVKFMAEVAKILNPSKKVLIPDLNAGCSLEDSCPPDAFKAFRQKYKDAISLTYINCSAKVKALSDIIVTSSSAEKIIRQIPLDKQIVFAPDKYLGEYLIKKTGRDMVLWQGSCIVHEHFSLKALVKLKTRHPNAIVIAHPECPQALLNYANFVGSTSALLNFTKENKGKEFIVLTESGIIHQMKKFSPESIFYPVPDEGGKNTDGSCGLCNNCPFMKLNTLEKIYACMQNGYPELVMEESLRINAQKPLLKMLEMSQS
jgi:quinolinate synthase